ncbi:threonine synthase [Defluviitalea raffinosedens]|uniref:Threonine synthase n=1 Tax=Defluviitalea raffinosedens TaxID=1450156 RepID=A0A7C8LCX2_9FIRM|nr:threonine synthase [Defluviitalea raffinosedens]KAE9633458.1 threonine synthase [Defluviitalea raffinosedens]HHW68144.1 threonine synthase [Candidatus Epulonipiscium sp.]
MNLLKYKSTRGGQSDISSAYAIVQGIAKDGGLFVPEALPKLEYSLEELKGMSYQELAYCIMKHFLTDFTEEELRGCIDKAYDQKFDTSKIAPLVKKDGVFFLELFHGPTLAFKDMALSILPHLLTTAAKKLNIEKEIVILTATSGDTGKAALEGFADVEGTKIIVFFPQDGVSEVQKRQMTTQTGDNTYVIGIKGNFDDAQNGVKEIFGDAEFNKYLDESNYMLSSANSINIGRLIPQVVYYFYAYFQMAESNDITLGEQVNVVVPTGNFGNILAAYYAKQMGLPIGKLICASNDNKVLYDFFNTGKYDKDREFILTISPSMDILISSNLERLIYQITGEDANKTKELMESLKAKGHYEIDDAMKEKLTDFYGGFATQEETTIRIKELFEGTGYLIDTHTAVAYSVYKDYVDQTKDTTKTIIASTASPYKFTTSVMGALDKKYEAFSDFELIKKMSELTKNSIPESIKDLDKRPILHTTVCSKDEMKKVVAEILK